MNTIQAEFEGYKKAVLAHVSENSVQMIETRRAFYGGAMSVIKIMAKIGEDSISEAAGVSILEGLAQEAIQFADDLGKGKA